MYLPFIRDQQFTARAETLPAEARPGIATLAWEAAFIGDYGLLGNPG